MAVTEGLQVIVIQKELKLFVCHVAVLEAIVVLVVSMVARCLELHKLSCSELSLVVAEEEAIVVVLCPLEEFVRRYSYMEDAREYAKVPKRLMILGKPEE